MPRRNDISKILMIGSGLLLLSGISCVTADARSRANNLLQKIVFESRCGAGPDQAPPRIFANTGLKSWKEYARVQDVPPLTRDNGERMFAVSLNSSGQKEVHLVQYNEDASMYYTYCYDPAGLLRFLRYEIHTDWGWGYLEERTLSPSGAIVGRSSRFIDSSNRKIPRPRQADDVPDFLKPTICRSFDSLPFIAAYKNARVNAP